MSLQPLRGRPRTLRRWLLVALGFGISAVFLVLLLGPVTMRATPTAGLHGMDKANAINATRQTLLAAVGGLVVMAGAAFTARTYYLSRRGQFTDRYTKGIELLASDEITERLGGIYALEHLMIESDRDHETVLEVLAAFVRDRTREPPAGHPANDAEHHHEGGDGRPRPDTDVQAALTVIGRRPHRPERNSVDLSYTDLCGADLGGLNLDGVYLWGTKLQYAALIGTHLKGAVLYWAQLQNADLTWAYMQRVRLGYAQLQGAKLIFTKLSRAELRNAHLQGAYLCGASLLAAELLGAQLQGADLTRDPSGELVRPVRWLTTSQLADAVTDDSTRLPDKLRDTLLPRWLVRLISDLEYRVTSKAASRR